jgi:hypothetical protein
MAPPLLPRIAAPANGQFSDGVSFPPESSWPSEGPCDRGLVGRGISRPCAQPRQAPPCRSGSVPFVVRTRTPGTRERTAMRELASQHSFVSGCGIRSLIWKVMAVERSLVPYALLDLVLPAGSLIVLLLLLYRRSAGLDGCAAAATSAQAINSPEHTYRNPAHRRPAGMTLGNSCK